MAHILPDGHPVGWQCPVCRTVWAPSEPACATCAPGPQITAAYVAAGHLGTPCPRPREGGLCGCDEADFEDAPRDCYQGRCSC